MPRLIRRDTGEPHELPDGVTQIGRLSANDIQVFEREVSRSHCHIEGPEGGWVILDHGTDLGTFVNGRRVRMIGLHQGDEIKVGSVVLVFDTSPPDATPPTKLVAEAPDAQEGSEPAEAEGAPPTPSVHLRPLSQASPQELVPSEPFLRVPRAPPRRRHVAAGVAFAAVAAGLAGVCVWAVVRPTPRRVVLRAADLLSRRDAEGLWALVADERKQEMTFEAFRAAVLRLPSAVVAAAGHLEVGEGRTGAVGLVVPVALQAGSERIAGEVVLRREGGRWKILDAPVQRVQELK